MSILRPRSFARALLFALAFTLTLTRLCHAAVEELLPDAAALTALEQRAQQAKPREQVYLYAEVISYMTEIAEHQILSGEDEHAEAMLKRVNHYADLLQQSLAEDTKRLKETEQLMHETTRHLGEVVHQASSDNQITVEMSLKHLNKVHGELLTRVFQH